MASTDLRGARAASATLAATSVVALATAVSTEPRRAA